MPHVPKRSPSFQACSFEHNVSGIPLRLGEPVLGSGGEQFDALKNDEEGVIRCYNSMPAAILFKDVSEKASMCEASDDGNRDRRSHTPEKMYEVSKGSLAEVGDHGRWHVLFDQHKREIESALVKWLNDEVRDRLESIDRSLLVLNEHGAKHPRSSGMIRQSVGRTSIRDCTILSRLRSHESLGDLGGLQTGSTGAFSIRDLWQAAKDDEHRNAHIEDTIRSHENARGRYAAIVRRFLKDPFSSRPAYVWSFVFPGVVLISILVSYWQTIDNCPLSRIEGQILQASCEALFAVELLLRFFVCPDRRTFCRNPLNVIDLLTCLPLCFRLAVAIPYPNVDDVVALDIVLPVLRLFKLVRRFEKFLLLLNAFMISLEALPVLLYTMLMIAMTFSGLIYAVEPRENIASLPQAMWFVMVTMTTCGYGDIFPSSIHGQFVCTVLMVVSILYTAMPIGIVGNAFSQTWDHRDRLLLMHRFRQAFLQRGFSEAAFRDVVTLFVGDCDSELGFDEFQAMLQTMNINISADRIHMLIHDLDEDGSGSISVDELLGGLFPQDYATFFGNLRAAQQKNDSFVKSPSQLA